MVHFYPQISAIETLFVYGGHKSGEDLSSVEAHSLSGSIVQCPQVQDLPQSVYAFPGLSIDGKPVMCGGHW